MEVLLNRSALRGVGLNPHLGSHRQLVERALHASKTLPPATHRLIEAVVVVRTVQIPVRLHSSPLRPGLWIDALWQLSRKRLHCGYRLPRLEKTPPARLPVVLPLPFRTLRSTGAPTTSVLKRAEL